MVARYPDPSGRDHRQRQPGHFFSLINLLVGNGHELEAYEQITSLLGRWERQPSLADPEARLMLRLWKLRLEYLHNSGGNQRDGSQPTIDEVQDELRQILHESSHEMLPSADSDSLSRDIESLAGLNPTALDPAQLLNRDAEAAESPWYLVGPTGWIPVQQHDGRVRHFRIRPPLPQNTTARPLWIPGGRFFELTPLDTGLEVDRFRDDVVKPVMAFETPASQRAVDDEPSMLDGPAPRLDRSAWYRVATTQGQIRWITFYDEQRNRVAITRETLGWCFINVDYFERRDQAWRRSQPDDWYIWQ